MQAGESGGGGASLPHKEFLTGLSLKKKRIFDDWFNEGCSFRLQFERAALTFKQQESAGKVTSRYWKTFRDVETNLQKLYGACNAMEPKQDTEFRDLLYLWEYCARNRNDARIFHWFKHLSIYYARKVEWEAPSFKPAPTGNSQRTYPHTLTIIH